MGLLEDLGIGFASLLGLKEKSIKENGGKIITQYATLEDVIEHLKGFVPKADPKLKTPIQKKPLRPN